MRSDMVKRARSHRFEMPYHVDPPMLTDTATGIDRVLLRGQHDRRAITVTLLDTPDERLSSAGVLLAHQVVGDTGHWLVKAPDWEPWLPAERFEPLEDGDELPEHLARLLRPFRRRATLGPVASVTVERAVYALLDPDSIEAGQLLDDRITVRRGGLAIGRHREVTLEPGPEMTSVQRSALVDRLGQAGGVRVRQFPDVVDRLTSLLHPLTIPGQAPDPESVTMEDFLTWRFGSRLHALIRAELQLVKGEVTDTELINTELTELAEELVGLSGVLEPTWVNDLRWRLDKVLALPARTRAGDLGDHYFEAMDALAAGTHNPRLRPGRAADGEPDDLAGAAASVVLGVDVSRQVAELVGAVDALEPLGRDEQWAGARDATSGLLRTLAATQPVLGAQKRAVRHLVKLLTRLDAGVSEVPTPAGAEFAGLDAQAAFEAGRAYQRSVDQVLPAREELVAKWPAIRERLLADWPQAVRKPTAELTAGTGQPETAAEDEQDAADE